MFGKHNSFLETLRSLQADARMSCGCLVSCSRLVMHHATVHVEAYCAYQCCDSKAQLQSVSGHASREGQQQR